MQGDFEAFYLRHFRAIYRVCYAFMKNTQDAEDCTEDAFVKAMTGGIAFENERHERAWLTTTAMNICKDKLKHWWRQKVAPLDEETEPFAAESDEKREVADAVMALPVKYKEVVWLHYAVRGLAVLLVRKPQQADAPCLHAEQLRKRHLQPCPAGDREDPAEQIVAE